MERKLVLRAVFFFTICLTRNLTAGTDVSYHSNKTLPRSTSTEEKKTGFRNEYVELGTTVSLNCTNTKIAWQDLIFVIWKISLRDKNCTIAVAKNDSDHDTCQDGKRLNRTADGVYHLIIPQFSVRDEGNYTCDISYESGGWQENIIVSRFARPIISGWLEYEDQHIVAVCEAKSKLAASIHWETHSNSSYHITQSTKPQESTVISHLYLPHILYEANGNPTCVATLNSLKHIKIKFFNFKFRDTSSGSPIILYCILGSIIPLLTALYIMRKKIRKLCCKPNPHQHNDPVDLQTYTSYMQSGNSIYNSLFSSALETPVDTHVYMNAQ